MVRLVAIGEGGRGCVEGDKARVCLARRAVARKAELRGAGAPLGCAFMVLGEEADRGRALSLPRQHRHRYPRREWCGE